MPPWSTPIRRRTGPGPTYKGGYGFSPLACFLDATNEALAVLLRPGNRAPHNADDHVEVLDLALAQLPVSAQGHRSLGGVAMLVRTDAAGASHKFVDALVERGIEFSIGMEMRKHSAWPFWPFPPRRGPMPSPQSVRSATGQRWPS